MNKVILLGRLTKIPEIKYSQINNSMVAQFTLAVNRKYVKQGEERQTDFINIIAWGKLAEFSQKYLQTGTQICISGRLQIRSWEDQNGQKRYSTEVIAEEIDFADTKKQGPDESILTGIVPQKIEATENLSEEFISGDDLPF